MSLNVFLSVGRTSTPEQEEFVRVVEKYLESNGITPKTVGRTYYRNQQPLKSVEECLKECAGTVIIAFERTHIQHGLEKRGSPTPIELDKVNLPTVWNQIEAAMSYSLGLPLLVLVEHGLKSEGLLEKGYDWYVKWVNLDKTILSDSEFVGVFADWKESAEKVNARGKNVLSTKDVSIDASSLTIGQIIKSLKPAQIWAIGAAIITALISVAVAAFKLGTLF